MLLSETCGLVSMGHLLWREDGSAISSAIPQWSESRRTRNHTLMSHLRLPQHGGPGSRIYIPQELGGPVIPPGTGFPLRHLLRFAPYDSQGYGAGILTFTLPGVTGPRICVYISFRNRMVQSKVEVTLWSPIAVPTQHLLWDQGRPRKQGGPERERERRKLMGGSERHYRLEGGVTET
jgi:hypothetical protein